MDFSYLLELAKKNEKDSKTEASKSRFTTNVSGAKKIKKTAPNIKAIQALLDKKDEDKAKADEEFKKKRANLLALRNQDRKSKQRVSAMINRTKGASKSVLEDAKDITTARGEEQCDEDDYGYESTMSQQIFSKLANTYAKMPEDDKLKFVKKDKKASIEDIKSRVINSLKKEEEEDMEPRKRKRKRHSMDDDFINDGDAFDDFDEPKQTDSKSKELSSQKSVNINLTNYKSDKYNDFKYDTDKSKSKERQDVPSSHKDKKKEKKSKPAAPPQMTFMELLKVAERKQSNPGPVIQVEKPVKDKEKKKENDRPLTAKEREELEEERRRRLKRLGKLPPEKKEETIADKGRKNGEADKGKKSEGKSDSTSKLQQALERPKPEPKVIDRSKYFAKPGAPPPMKKESKPVLAPKNPPSKAHNVPSREQPSKEIKPKPSKEIKPQKSREFPPKNLKPLKSRDFPSKNTSRQFPPPDVRRGPQNMPPPKRGRIESDSEEEYDSEMDDFIDDGDVNLDYSSEIRKMFGYDRNKYVDEEDDLDDMEASFSQMQKEERISAKIGLQEDLEDIRMEELEKKQKMTRLKQIKNRGRR